MQLHKCQITMLKFEKYMVEIQMPAAEPRKYVDFAKCEPDTAFKH